MDVDDDPSFFDNFHPFPTPEPEHPVTSKQPIQSGLGFPATSPAFEMARQIQQFNKAEKARMVKLNTEERQKKWNPIIAELKKIMSKAVSSDEILQKVGPSVSEYLEALKQSVEVFDRRNELLRIIEAGPVCQEQQIALELFCEIRNLDEGSILRLIMSVLDPDDPRREYARRVLKEKEFSVQFRQYQVQLLLMAFDQAMLKMTFDYNKKQAKKEETTVSTEVPEATSSSGSTLL